MSLRMWWLTAVWLMGLLFAAPALAQSQPVPLAPFDDPLMQVQGVIPDGWTAAGNGLYRRGQAAGDLALLAVQTALARRAQIEAAIAPQLGLSALPEPAGMLQTDAYAWTLYQVDIAVPGAGTVRVDLALADGADGRVTIVLLQALADEYEALHEGVFLPVVQALAPRAEAAQAERTYTDENVTFPGGAADVTLAGTLSLPAGAGPFPAVVLVTGSGPQDRDESLAPLTALRPFALIADALAQAGVAVLRYDDRGVGRSTGDFDAALTEDFRADAAAAIDYLLTREEIDPAQIGLLGHSEGGIIAAMLGASDPDMAFVIGMAPPAMRGVELLVEQNVAILRASAEGDAFSEAGWSDYEDRIRSVLEAAAAGDSDSTEALLRETFGWLYDTIAPEMLAQMAPETDRETFIEQSVQAQMPTLTSRWYQALLNIDAGEYWHQVTIPVLGIFGGLDVQVPAARNASAMQTALEEAGNADHSVITLPDANHLFQAAQTGTIEEYGTLPAAFTPDFLPTLVDWVLAHVRVVE
jgi:alpha/beta superfamily hydrolase